MTTCYFDRNVFDQIDKSRDVTDDDLGVLREAIRRGKIQILVSFGNRSRNHPSKQRHGIARAQADFGNNSRCVSDQAAQ